MEKTGDQAGSSQPPPNLHLPCMDLINDENAFKNICVPLHKACMEADWAAAKLILDERPELVRYAITPNGDAPLHVVTGSGTSAELQMIFIQNLINLMQGNEINLHNKDGKTGLDFAVNAALMEQTCDQAGSSQQQQRPPLNLHLPCMDLINDENAYMNICVPLHKACMEADWSAAKPILDERPELVRYAITPNGDAPLHVVTRSGTNAIERVIFVQNLVNLMQGNDINLQNKDGKTGLHFAMASVNVPQMEKTGDQAGSSQPPPNLHLPCMDLINDENAFKNICVPLHKACMEADWAAAKLILDERPKLVRYAITPNGDAPLHVVTGSGTSVEVQKTFVQNLVNLMQGNDINLENKDGKTGLDFSMASVNVPQMEKTGDQAGSSQPPPNPHLPCMDLINDENAYLNICVPLHNACMEADWAAAKLILDERPELVRYAITPNGDAPLHVVTGSGTISELQMIFIQNLVNLMQGNDINLENKDGKTGLDFSMANVTDEMLLGRNKALPIITTRPDVMPATTVLNTEHTVVEIESVNELNPLTEQQQQQQQEQPRPPANLPCMDLISRDENDYRVPLQSKPILDECPVLVSNLPSVEQPKITVPSLVNLMQNKGGRTGFQVLLGGNIILTKHTVGATPPNLARKDLINGVGKTAEISPVDDQQNLSSSNYERPQLKLPCMDLVNDDPRKKDYFSLCVPLYQACMKADWKAAEAILASRPDLVRYSMTQNGNTMLHVVAGSKRRGKQMETFVKNLLKIMTIKDLVLCNKDHCTAFHLAVVVGNITLVKLIMKTDKDLLTIPAHNDVMPLYAAALFGKHEVVNYLYHFNEMDDAVWTPEARCLILEACLESEMFDVALKIANKYSDLRNRSEELLEVLARKPDVFSDRKSNVFWRTMSSVFALIGSKVGAGKESKALQLLTIIWENMVKHDLQEFAKMPLFTAAEMGNTKFVVELISRYPELSWKVNGYNQTIFHVAVKHRRQDIYSLLYEIGTMKDLIIPMIDNDGNNLLHLAAMRSTRLEDVSGVLLQMQQELLWFKEVESIMPLTCRVEKNKGDRTPHKLFTEEHKDLVTQGEKWMKETASQCMVVSTLIATIVFASAFTVPGGYNQNNGIPVLYSRPAFITFVVADALSLFSASTSILLFLSILTSRYAEHDFSVSLPNKLISGLVTLLLSIITMMIAFSASFFVLYHKDLKWMPILICMLAAVPVLLYVVLQYKLFIDIMRSTYGFRPLFKFRKDVYN